MKGSNTIRIIKTSTAHDQGLPKFNVHPMLKRFGTNSAGFSGLK
jgi:hypothetical protein